uniref:Ubiquitin-associated domain-containing protein 1-like n=1 Tax=Phallusia mammillata TaxID=59560 RepID=A0A6F9DVF8_9ASCI|nr:ubiquitin-associated domain-containing protein 1-like [Phallusia mammillata]
MDTKLMSPRPPSCLQVAASDMFGNEANINISADMLIEKVKEVIIKQLTAESENASNYGQYKLVLIQDMPRSLCDEKTAKQETVDDGDCILLIKNRNPKQPVSSLVKDGIASHDGPSQSAIARATEGLPSLGGVIDEKIKKSSSDLTASTSTQVEQTLRRVLLALLDLSYKFVEFDKGTVEEKPDPVDAQQMKELTDMGYSESLARKALLLYPSNKQQALEWLLTHQDETPMEEAGTSSAIADEPMDTTSAARPRMRTRSFKPNPIHLASLLDMGFTEEESIQALKINGNNPNSACDWLLSDRKMDSEDCSDEPLDQNSELYKALVSNPTIHIGLHDRKVLEALEDMVENPMRRNSWAYESAVGNVILQILKLYNKYSTTAPQN